MPLKVTQGGQKVLLYFFIRSKHYASCYCTEPESRLSRLPSLSTLSGLWSHVSCIKILLSLDENSFNNYPAAVLFAWKHYSCVCKVNFAACCLPVFVYPCFSGYFVGSSYVCLKVFHAFRDFFFPVGHSLHGIEYTPCRFRAIEVEV